MDGRCEQSGEETGGVESRHRVTRRRYQSTTEPSSES
jgi:hypothetical protein